MAEPIPEGLLIKSDQTRVLEVKLGGKVELEWNLTDLRLNLRLSFTASCC